MIIHIIIINVKKAYEKIVKENDDMEKQYEQECNAFIEKMNDIINEKRLMEYKL